MALALEDHLRLLLGERVPEGGTDADTFFSDLEITDLLDTFGDVLLAAAAGWRSKAAEFAKYIDIDESGSTRKLSQMYRQAELQANYFSKAAGEDSTTRTAALAGGVVARSAAWAVPPDQGIADRVHNAHGEMGPRRA